mgnify:CR=1 FL=1
MAKEISEDDRLKVIAMATMANEHYRDACKLDKAIQRLLGMPGNYYGEGRIGDVIYDADGISVAAIDEALKSDGFTVSEDA